MDCALSEMGQASKESHRFVRAYRVRQVYALLKAVERLKDSSNDRDIYLHIIFNEDDGFPGPFTEGSVCFPQDGDEVRYPDYPCPDCYSDDEDDEDEKSSLRHRLDYE